MLLTMSVVLDNRTTNTAKHVRVPVADINLSTILRTVADVIDMHCVAGHQYDVNWTPPVADIEETEFVVV